MQLKRIGAKQVGAKYSLMANPALNIQAGTELLKWWVDNRGRGNVQEGLWWYGERNERYIEQILMCVSCLDNCGDPEKPKDCLREP
jgi:hypothetical protein